ncbi:MAG: type II and III secretion system protein family protein [Turicibacter sp.]
MLNNKMQSFLFCLLLFPLIAFGADTNDIYIGVGDAKTIELKEDVLTVFVSAPTVADYKVIGNRSIVIYGLDSGVATVIGYNKGHKEIFKRKIIVNHELTKVREILHSQYPNESINLENVAEQVVISGLVSTEDVKNGVYNLVGTMLKKKNENNVYAIAASGNNAEDDKLYYTAKYNFNDIINNLKVVSVDQINVKITVAEVSSSFLTNLGISYSSLNNDTGIFVNNLLDFSAKDIVSVIAANGNDSIGQILAEPNLTVFSGEQASFLVGGEIPIAIRDQDGISIEYKEYGIRLSMVGRVLGDGNIRLTLNPEVSSLDEANQTSTGLVSIPALRTRKAQTTVQLNDGQSFILAGLLSSEDGEALSKIPYLGDIPILGALFSKTKTVRTRTELIIIATVNTVSPIKEYDVKLPIFNQTNDLQRLLGIEFGELKNSELESIMIKGGFN